MPAVAEGRAGVQDEGSQLVALALASAPIEGADVRWLDLCAGPGGKAALLAALAADRGARRGRQRAAAPSGRPGPPRARRRRRASRRSPSPTAPQPPWPHGLVRPGAGRRAVHRARAPCGAGPRLAGGASRTTSRRWSRSSGPCWRPRRRPGPPRRRGPLRHLLAGARRDPRRRRVAAGQARRREARDAAALLTAAAGLRADVPDCAGPLQGTVQLWPHRHGTDAMFLALLRRA